MESEDSLRPDELANDNQIESDMLSSAPSKGLGRARSAVDWLAGKLSLILMLVTDFVYTKKYNAVNKQLGYAPAESRFPERGFVIIQIDALGFEHLAEAMESGYAPNMKRLVQRRGFRFHSWRSGLPSSTPSVQAGIMYGENFDIPAFRWYDKTTNRKLVCKLPSVLRNLQAQVAKDRTGIMSGGSSYVNLIDGGAKWSIFTLSSVARSGLLGSVKGIGFFLLFLLSPIRAVRMLLYIMAEYFIELGQRIGTYFSHGPRVRREGIFPFLRIFSNVVFRELQTFGIIIDMYRGVRSIYSTYSGYDEMGHHFGPKTKAAYKVVKSIDRQIRYIDRMRRHTPNRIYDLYIVSDHGQTPAQPFTHDFGMTLGEYVKSVIGDDSAIAEDYGTEDDRSWNQVKYLIEEIELTERRLKGKRSARLVSGMRNYMEHRLPHQDPEPLDLSKREDVVVVASSSLANIYFNAANRKMNLSEIESMYPGLTDKLVQHEGTAMIAAVEGDHVVALSKDGRMTLSDLGTVITGENPMAQFEEPDIWVDQLKYLMSFPHGGDLVVFGAYRNGVVTTFEEQVGGHGGLGGPQGYPFIIHPGRYDLNTLNITNAAQYYNHFITTYPLDGAKDQPVEEPSPEEAHDVA